MNYDFGIIEESKDNSFKHIIKENCKKHYQQAKYYNNKLNNELPKKDELIYIITQAKFNQFAFTLAVLEKEEIEKLYISSYNVKIDLLKALEFLLKDRIKYCKLIITWSIKARSPEVYNYITKLKKLKNFDVVYCDNHSKISCIKTKNNYYIVSGSGNFTATNTKMENYTITNDRELYKFYTDWFEEQKNLEDKYIKKIEGI
jgi:hypothetical protein